MRQSMLVAGFLLVFGYVQTAQTFAVGRDEVQSMVTSSGHRRYDTRATKMLFDAIRLAPHDTQWKDVVRLIKERRANPNIERFGRTPLFIVTHHGDQEALASVLQCGADPNQGDGSWNKSLFCTLDLNKVQLLVNAGADLKAKGLVDENLLLFAVRSNGGLPLINYYCDKGVSPNESDSLGNTALYFLLRCDQGLITERLSKARRLIDAGAKLYGEDAHQQTFDSLLNVTGDVVLVAKIKSYLGRNSFSPYAEESKMDV